MKKPGLIADRYRCLSLLGTGGFADVYLAEDLRLANRHVALKLLATHVIDDEERLKKFKQEAQIIAYLTSPYTVRAFDFGQDQAGNHYIAMEYVQGDTLHTLLQKEKRLSVERSLILGIQLLDALEEAHGMGVVHRDLKPKNLIVVPHRKGEFIKVLDFGVARIIQQGTEEEDDWTLVGTATYMSPEQAQGLTLGPTSDLYSVGVLLYHMLSGTPPFTTQEDPVALMIHHATTQAKSLCSAYPNLNIPKEVDQAILKALEKKPYNRFEGASKFREQLESALEKIEPLESGSHSHLLTINAGTANPARKTLSMFPKVEIEKAITEQQSTNKETSSNTNQAAQNHSSLHNPLDSKQQNRELNVAKSILGQQASIPLSIQGPQEPSATVSSAPPPIESFQVNKLLGLLPPTGIGDAEISEEKREQSLEKTIHPSQSQKPEQKVSLWEQVLLSEEDFGEKTIRQVSEESQFKEENSKPSEVQITQETKPPAPKPEQQVFKKAPTRSPFAAPESIKSSKAVSSSQVLQTHKSPKTRKIEDSQTQQVINKALGIESLQTEQVSIKQETKQTPTRSQVNQVLENLALQLESFTPTDLQAISQAQEIESLLTKKPEHLKKQPAQEFQPPPIPKKPSQDQKSKPSLSFAMASQEQPPPLPAAGQGSSKRSPVKPTIVPIGQPVRYVEPATNSIQISEKKPSPQSLTLEAKQKAPTSSQFQPEPKTNATKKPTTTSDLAQNTQPRINPELPSITLMPPALPKESPQIQAPSQQVNQQAQSQGLSSLPNPLLSVNGLPSANVLQANSGTLPQLTTTDQGQPFEQRPQSQVLLNQALPPQSNTQQPALWQPPHLNQLNPSGQFNNTPQLNPSGQFNNTPQLNPSGQFNNTPQFSPSGQFNNTPQFSPSGQFNNTPQFSPSGQFNNTPQLNQAGDASFHGQRTPFAQGSLQPLGQQSSQAQATSLPFNNMQPQFASASHSFAATPPNSEMLAVNPNQLFQQAPLGLQSSPSQSLVPSDDPLDDMPDWSASSTQSNPWKWIGILGGLAFLLFFIAQFASSPSKEELQKQATTKRKSKKHKELIKAGDQAASRGEFNTAYRIYQKALLLKPDNIEIQRRIRQVKLDTEAKVLFQTGKKAFTSKKYLKSFQIFEKLDKSSSYWDEAKKIMRNNRSGLYDELTEGIEKSYRTQQRTLGLKLCIQLAKYSKEHPVLDQACQKLKNPTRRRRRRRRRR